MTKNPPTNQPTNKHFIKKTFALPLPLKQASNPHLLVCALSTINYNFMRSK